MAAKSKSKKAKSEEKSKKKAKAKAKALVLAQAELSDQPIATVKLESLAEPEVAEIIESEKPKKSKAAGTWGCYPKSISRIESLKHKAWYVRIYFQGAYVRKTFSDSVYGGQESALQEALLWRDEMEQRMGKPRTDRSVRKKDPVEGKDVGIYRRKARHVKRGRVYYRDIYEVTWTPEPGKVWRKTISVTKHGEEKALEMARAIRREKEREYYGATVY